MKLTALLLVCQCIVLILMVFVLSNVLLRLQRLEAGSGSEPPTRSWAHIVGRPMPASLSESIPGGGSDAVVLLLSGCDSCLLVAAELRARCDTLKLSAPLIVVPLNGSAPISSLTKCHGVAVPATGGQIARDLGIRSAPFGLLYRDGQIADARSVLELDELIQLGSAGRLQADHEAFISATPSRSKAEDGG